MNEKEREAIMQDETLTLEEKRVKLTRLIHGKERKVISPNDPAYWISMGMKVKI